MAIEKLTVLGAGTMGHGIAQAAAVSGLEVMLYDIDRQMLDKAVLAVKANIEKHFVAKGKLSREEGDAVMARLRVDADLHRAAEQADYVIEAVPEKMDLKKSLFAQLDSICPPHTILATNTSVMSVTAISGATKRQEKCIGTHFFNPAAIMKLVEVVTPLGVSEETLETTLSVCRKMGKMPIKVKDVPGFIVNRLLMGLYMEAAQMVLEGTATAEEIDTAMRLGAGHPMGPCELADFGGFDVIQMASDEVFSYTHCENDRLNILYRKMLEAGRLGRKNGKGFYDYLEDGTKKPFTLFS
ncbi:MAG: 3-hydroxyacyl-CoA dehydrogenase family protein [Desulfomonile tiedjei]|uniref:3-hydroxyacyl-CoA dehydrogenase family protein n=1 Tax=Desulfomonile tiedjei TaxID=2358 RepID=A0A9D6YZY4_9BACT|nr:3-hydroxyacyl-CoA dehydrogenase family protein [Desulfomonile tiedjei]